MPEISRFYGIVITINYNEHLPPHFHARYADARASVSMTGEVLVGSLPTRAMWLVREWARTHEAELVLDWDRARLRQPLVPIPPLD